MQLCAKSENNVINVVAYVRINLHVSLHSLGIGKPVQRILTYNKYHPSKLHLLQELRSNDFNRRVEYYLIFLITFYSATKVIFIIKVNLID